MLTDLLFVLERRIQEFESRCTDGGDFESNKLIKEYDDVQILDLDDNLYLVTGSNRIFLLGENAGEDWARLLTDKEIKDLPVVIHWNGPTTCFEASSKFATEKSNLKLQN